MTTVLMEAIENEFADAREFMRKYEHVLRQSCQVFDAPAIRVLNAYRVFYNHPKAKTLADLTEAIEAYAESRITKLIIVEPEGKGEDYWANPDAS